MNNSDNIKIITDLLKKGWQTNLSLIKACNASSADRVFRYCRQKHNQNEFEPWQGYELQEKIIIGNIKQFRLIRCK